MKSDVMTSTYAIFETGGKQYQAIPGKTVAIEKLDAKLGDTVSFDKVLLRKVTDQSGKETLEIGTPHLSTPIKASVLRQDKAPKIIIFRFKRRKGYKKKSGHRQPFTVVRIDAI